jgi:hypothetical protein
MHISPDTFIVAAVGIGVPFLLTIFGRLYNRAMLQKAGYSARIPDDITFE